MTKTTSSPGADGAGASPALLALDPASSPGPVPDLDTAPEDEDAGDVPSGIDEDALDRDDLDDDRIAS